MLRRYDRRLARIYETRLRRIKLLFDAGRLSEEGAMNYLHPVWPDQHYVLITGRDHYLEFLERQQLELSFPVTTDA